MKAFPFLFQPKHQHPQQALPNLYHLRKTAAGLFDISSFCPVISASQRSLKTQQALLNLCHLHKHAAQYLLSSWFLDLCLIALVFAPQESLKTQQALLNLYHLRKDASEARLRAAELDSELQALMERHAGREAEHAAARAAMAGLAKQRLKQEEKLNKARAERGKKDPGLLSQQENAR